jgi:ABC-2 type transport system permease protein
VSAVGLTIRQVRFTNKSFWRNPASAFFTFAFPLMFLVIFTSLLGDGDAKIGSSSIRLTTYYVVAMASFGVISACYTNIAISTSFNRDAGILKRTRGTPLPGAAYLMARVIHATLVGFLLVIITSVFGVAFYNASVPTGLPLVEFVVTLIVGSLSFAALSLALTSVIPNADASPAIVNASILPLLFLSGIFIKVDDTSPAWVRVVGKIFPVRHFADAMRDTYLGNVVAHKLDGTIFHPFTLNWTDVLVIAAWGVAGLVLAARFFSWEPRK